MQTRSAQIRAFAALVLIVSLTLAGTISASLAWQLPGKNGFNVVDWELRNFAGKWLYLGHQAVHGRLSASEEDARIASYLELTARIDRLAARPDDDGTAARERADLRERRAGIENTVEAIIEGRITSTLDDLGLDSSVPLFPDARWVFPPVDFELDQPPNELVISRRDRIELIEQRPLRHDLSLPEMVAIEAREERPGDTSALIEPLGGVATYPSLVRPQTSYQRLIELVAHEWLHQYLFFKPLGRRVASNLELRTLNEAVATLAGEELAAIVMLQHPLRPPYDSQLTARELPVSAGAVLTQLRVDVDALLAYGQIDAAEALMEQRRQDLAAVGVVYRRINQAFFAFRNTYATEPGSTDPIGPKMTVLRQQSGSLVAFLRAAADLTSEADLDVAIAEP
jgi:hypothetical protein